MIKVSREWATPLTIGVFLLMGVTGLLMFFHWDNSLQKTLHEWLGWLMVAAAVVHALANWLGFKRYFRPGPALWAVLLSALVLAGSFIPWPGGAKKGPSTPALAIQTLSVQLNQNRPFKCSQKKRLVSKIPLNIIKRRRKILKTITYLQ